MAVISLYCKAPGRGQIFRQSTRDSVISVVMEVRGWDGSMCNFEVVVRCDTLHSYADGVHVVPTAAAVGDVIAKEGNENSVVLLNAWGPRAAGDLGHGIGFHAYRMEKFVR